MNRNVNRIPLTRVAKVRMRELAPKIPGVLHQICNLPKDSTDWKLIVTFDYGR